MKLLIKFATRGRGRQFFECLTNIHSTIGSENFEIIVSCDTDDVEMNNHRVREKLKQFTKVKVFYGPPVSKVAAINRDMEHCADWDWLINYSDDMTFTVKGWYDKMLKDIKGVWGESLDFFAHFSDGFVKDKLPTMSIMGREYYERDGYIYHNSYGSVSCDAEAMFVAMMRGRHHYFPTVYFHHVHPANVRKAIDHIYKRNDRFGNQDTENYFRRRENLFYVENPVMVPFNPKVRE